MNGITIVLVKLLELAEEEHGFYNVAFVVGTLLGVLVVLAICETFFWWIYDRIRNKPNETCGV